MDTQSVLYHGSPKRFRNLKPKAHYLADHRPVVFATPLREIALASLQPWNDEIFEQGVVGEDPPYMMELWPNAFRDVYGGKRGYLYTLAPDTFYHTNRLTRFEQISDVSPEILDVEVIEDVLSALQNSNLQMIYFEEAEAFRMKNYRQNPWLKNQLYFRYGFWDLEPNANMMYHVTPKLSAILDSSELSSRASRKSKVEGLGGGHDVSVSYYGSLNRAAFTLMYLYRIWQVKEGILTLQDLAEIAGWDDDLVTIVERYQPHELVNQVRISLGAPNPIVFGDSWADGLTEDDFAILCFKNPCRHLYVDNLLKLSQRTDDTVIKALAQDSIQNLRRNVDPFCYFGSHSDGLIRIYSEIRKLLHEGKSQITYGWETYKNEKNIREVFIGLSYKYPREWYGQDVIQFENITIDLRKQPVNIEDLCLYYQFEQEFQLFRSMPMSELWTLYTIHDILREAKARNGGIEPFFWDMDYGIEGFPTWSKFQLATWVDEDIESGEIDPYERMNNDRQNPYIDKDRYGYLLNPQYSEWARAYESRRGEGDTTLWVHATESDVSGWLDPNFKIKGDRFYIGGGANADLFGTNLVFVKYKPTKIFDFDSDYDDNDFLECAYRELTSLSQEDKFDFITFHARFMDEPEDILPTFDDLSKPQIIELLKSGLASSNYSFFENSYVQNCLVKFGYTAYYESEGCGGVSTAWEDINLAILPADFDNLEIVGVALCTDQEKGYYECPNCRYSLCSKKEILAGTLYKGTVLCEDCSKGSECSICDNLTPESSVEVEEYDSWGDRSIICISCVEDRRCEYCEEFFDPSEIRSAKFTKTSPRGSYVQRTTICDECFEENRDDFDEDQDPRT